MNNKIEYYITHDPNWISKDIASELKRDIKIFFDKKSSSYAGVTQKDAYRLINRLTNEYRTIINNALLEAADPVKYKDCAYTVSCEEYLNMLDTCFEFVEAHPTANGALCMYDLFSKFEFYLDPKYSNFEYKYDSAKIIDSFSYNSEFNDKIDDLLTEDEYEKLTDIYLNRYYHK